MTYDYTSVAIDQAIRDGIASTPDQLTVRDIIVDFDLLDENKQTITKREWIQPVNGVYAAGDVEKDILVYGDIAESRDKVIIFTGMRAIQSVVYSSSITFSTPSAIKGIEEMQTMDTGTGTGSFGVKQFVQPYIYKAAEDLKIYFHPNTTSIGQQDRIMLIGVVCEQYGTHAGR